MEFVTSYLQGLFVGLIFFGFNNLKMTTMMDGDWFKCIFLSIGTSVAFFFGISYAANQQIPEFSGYSTASVVVASWIAYKRGKPWKR